MTLRTPTRPRSPRRWKASSRRNCVASSGWFLNPRELKFITLYHGLDLSNHRPDHTYGSIAKQEGITPERVRQIVNGGYAKLRIDPRTCEIIRLRLQGKSNEQVAVAFQLDAQRIEQHIQQVLEHFHSNPRVNTILRRKLAGETDQQIVMALQFDVGQLDDLIEQAIERLQSDPPAQQILRRKLASETDEQIVVALQLDVKRVDDAVRLAVGHLSASPLLAQALNLRARGDSVSVVAARMKLPEGDVDLLIQQGLGKVTKANPAVAEIAQMRVERALGSRSAATRSPQPSERLSACWHEPTRCRRKS